MSKKVVIKKDTKKMVHFFTQVEEIKFKIFLKKNMVFFFEFIMK
jgi:hypothetical protein